MNKRARKFKKDLDMLLNYYREQIAGINHYHKACDELASLRSDSILASHVIEERFGESTYRWWRENRERTEKKLRRN